MFCFWLSDWLLVLFAVSFYLNSDRPDEAQQFSPDCGYDFLLVLAGGDQVAVALMEPVLGGRTDLGLGLAGFSAQKFGPVVAASPGRAQALGTLSASLPPCPACCPRLSRSI
jgi:hypothetical protein